jgi:heterodisulfide reductase subunit C
VNHVSRESRSVARVDPSFKYELIKVPGGEKIMLCLQCGTCTADCPVGQRVSEFRPRHIVRSAMLGLKERLFSEDILWLCTGCYLCYERCPQGVKPTDVIVALRSMAVREGRIHPSFQALVTALAKDGYIYEISDFVNETRQEMGLPTAPGDSTAEVRKIMKRTGLDKIAGMSFEGG